MFSACNNKVQSWWYEPQIPVLAPEEAWEKIEAPLSDIFEKVVRTPQVEKQYHLLHGGDADLDRYTHSRYIIIAASLESEGRIADLVRNSTQNPEVRKRIESGEQFYFVQRDIWAKDQMLIILVAKDSQTLRSQLQNYGEQLYDIVDADAQLFFLDQMFDSREQLEEAEELRKTYGWSIRMQSAFFVAHSDPAKGLVWFRRTHPERWIFVRWIDDPDTTGVFSQDWVVNERNRIGKEYYGEDKVAEPYLFSYSGEFLDRPAQITQGLWENDIKVAGGPFRNYTFYDAVSERLYMIDVACHAPGKDKYPFLRRLDVIAHTFKTLFD